MSVPFRNTRRGREAAAAAAAAAAPERGDDENRSDGEGSQHDVEEAAHESGGSDPGMLLRCDIARGLAASGSQRFLRWACRSCELTLRPVGAGVLADDGRALQRRRLNNGEAENVNLAARRGRPAPPPDAGHPQGLGAMGGGIRHGVGRPPQVADVGLAAAAAAGPAAAGTVAARARAGLAEVDADDLRTLEQKVDFLINLVQRKSVDDQIVFQRMADFMEKTTEVAPDIWHVIATLTGAKPLLVAAAVKASVIEFYVFGLLCGLNMDTDKSRKSKGAFKSSVAIRTFKDAVKARLAKQSPGMLARATDAQIELAVFSVRTEVSARRRNVFKAIPQTLLGATEDDLIEFLVLALDNPRDWLLEQKACIHKSEDGFAFRTRVMRAIVVASVAPRVHSHVNMGVFSAAFNLLPRVTDDTPMGWNGSTAAEIGDLLRNILATPQLVMDDKDYAHVLQLFTAKYQ